MIRPLHIAALSLAGILPALACDDDSRDYDPDSGAPIEVSAGQEDDMCGNFGSSTYKPTTAGPSIDDCGALDGQPGLKRVTLTEIEDGHGGYLRLTVPPENEAPVFLMFDTELPFAVVREGGEEVGFIEQGTSSDRCDEARGRYLWTVEDSTNYLQFGPGAAGTVDLVLEVVE